MKNKILIPYISFSGEKGWTEITYHPEPIITRIKLGGDRCWQEQIPGCKIEVLDEDLGWMKNLVDDIKVKIIYPEDWMEMYIEPLATIHTKFFNNLSELLYKIYPIGRNMAKFKLGGHIHSVIAEFYWDKMKYKDHTPSSWVNTLNLILDFVEKNRITSKEEVVLFEKKLSEELLR